MAENTGKIIGIDLGTTNSVVASDPSLHPRPFFHICASFELAKGFLLCAR